MATGASAAILRDAAQEARLLRMTGCVCCVVTVKNPPSPKKKKDQLSLAQSDGELTPLRTGPIPKAPGGWGLRNPEPKGPGQRSALLFAKPHGVGLAEVGHHCDSANDPVT
jgi:hypothetical protein